MSDEMSFVQRLQEERKAKAKGIYYLTQINLAYNSNKIEGSKLSEEQTRYLYETGQFMVEKEQEVIQADDIVESMNHFRAFDYILDNYEKELSATMLKTLHKILKQSTSDENSSYTTIGEFKKYPNIIGNIIQITTTPPENVEEEMQELITSYENKSNSKTLEDLTDFHVAFETIHPFSDGNGRIGRLILFKECLRHNIIPFVLNENHRIYYYKGLDEYRSGSKERLLDTFGASQDIYEKTSLHFGIHFN